MEKINTSNVKRHENLHETSIQLTKWQSEIGQMIERLYTTNKSFKNKILFLSEVYLEYVKNHTFGEYDETIFIEEDMEIARIEIRSFLCDKFEEINLQIRKQLLLPEVIECKKNIEEEATF